MKIAFVFVLGCLVGATLIVVSEAVVDEIDYRRTPWEPSPVA